MYKRQPNGISNGQDLNGKEHNEEQSNSEVSSDTETINSENDQNQNQNRVIYLRIDNLPPGKTWKQIKYLIGGIIHHSNVLQVKLLPPVTSIIPPFVTFQSCLVILRGSLNPNALNKLIRTLNTYQWDYFDLYVYELPILNPMFPNKNSDNGIPPSNSTLPISPLLQRPQTLFSPQMQGTPISKNVPGPPPPPPPGPPQPNQMSQSPHSQPHPPISVANMQPPPSPFPPAYPFLMPSNNFSGKIVQPLPPPPPPAPPATSSSVSRFVNAYNNSASQRQYNPRAFDGHNIIQRKSISNQYLTSQNKTNKSRFKMFKNIFNENAFRKQMTNRGMFQIRLENFPPYFQIESLRLLENNQNIKINDYKDTVILPNRDAMGKYCRLKWTILKDFIKLKCPKLLELDKKRSMNAPTLTAGYSGMSQNEHRDVKNNTREFYVGVYEYETTKFLLRFQSEPAEKTYSITGILYKAVIGFHDKEYCDLCLKLLQDQEYSQGYKLRVLELPPFEEEEDSGEDEFTEQEQAQEALVIDANNHSTVDESKIK